MLEKESEQEQLLLEMRNLRQELEQVKREKLDLESLLQQITISSENMTSLTDKNEADSPPNPQSKIPPLIISDLETDRILYGNPESELMFHVPTSQFVKHQLQEFYSDPAERQTLLDILAKDGHVRNYELQAKKATGNLFWVRVSVKPVTFQERGALVSIFFDLTHCQPTHENFIASEIRLHRQSLALLNLGREPDLNCGDLNLAIRKITEVASHTLEVEKVSVWLYNDFRFAARPMLTKTPSDHPHQGLKGKSKRELHSDLLTHRQEGLIKSIKSKLPYLKKLICLDLYERSLNRHRSLLEIPSNESRFSILDVTTLHKNSANLSIAPLISSSSYPELELNQLMENIEENLLDLQDSSTLNIPIKLGGQIVGIICHEHRGSPRQWVLEERTFMNSLANLIALAIAGFERQRVQEALTKAKQELEGIVEQRTALLKGANRLLRMEIAQRKQAEEALKQSVYKAEGASRAKSTFLANMSHELRTPLNAIIGYSEILSEEALEEGLNDIIPDINRIRTAGQHLLSLINDILDLSKIEAGRMDLYLETFQISALIDEVITTVHPLVEKNHNHLEVICPVDIGSIHADLTKLRQILLNLLSNALKFTENGTVQLKVTREKTANNDWIYLSVKDTGIGISSEQQERLFEAFIQGDNSTTRKYGGTGLGLVISRRFCQMMGGDICVESQPGVGSTFTVHLRANIDPPSYSE